MKKNKKYIVLAVLLVWLAGSCSAYFVSTYHTGDHQLIISALNIGQGDSIYIRTPQGKDILIDGGPDTSVISELGQVMPPWDRTLELVLATHSDMDHIGGLVELPHSYTVKQLFRSYVEGKTATYHELDQWGKQGTPIYYPVRGEHITIEPDLWLEFLHPAKNTQEKEVNDYSLVCILHYKQFSAMFTGDISDKIEKELVQLPMNLDVDVLKVAHHGSRTSSSSEFLQAAKPEIALISVGKNNKYGHPTYAALSRLQKVGAQVFRTDTQGRITCESDGYTVHCAGQ